MSLKGQTWQKPQRCGSGASDCVEVLKGEDAVRLRDSKNPGVELAFSHDEWRAFIGSAHDGQYEL